MTPISTQSDIAIQTHEGETPPLTAKAVVGSGHIALRITAGRVYPNHDHVISWIGVPPETVIEHLDSIILAAQELRTEMLRRAAATAPDPDPLTVPGE